MPPEQLDLIVIGAGSAAREAATRAATEHDARVAVIERERWGGQCPNVACKPTKQYVAAAELLRDLQVVGGELGIEAGPATFDLARLKARKEWLIGTQETWRSRFEDAGYETIDGEASFADERTVRVGDRELTSSRILIATGSRTAVPPIAGLDDIPWIDHIGALELTELPESLLVLGAGPVGLELAQSFSRFGSQVILVQSGDRIAPRSDADAAAALTAALVEEGIEIVIGSRVTQVERDGDGLIATLSPKAGGEPSTIRAQTLLVASGRVPNVEALTLEAAGVEHGRGGIAVDERLRTNVAGIWAAGDVAATVQLTPVATLQAQVVVDDMFGEGARTMDYSIIPTSIFTDPELASVGLTEDAAREQGFEVETSTHAAGDLVKPYYLDATHGLLKLVYERGSRRLLGLHAVVRGGGELLQGYAVALKLGATVDDLALGHYVFPSYGEGIHYAAEAVLTAEGV